MNRKILISVAALSILLGACLALRTLNSNRQAVQRAVPVPTEPQAVPGKPVAHPVAERAIPEPPTAVSVSSPPRENIVPENGGAAQQVVRIKPDRILATVNGVSITLKDLIPLPKEKAGSEQMLSAEMYDFLFHRAVEREVTFQAARAQGAELTESQKQHLAQLRGESERQDPAVFDNLHQSSENLDFEQRDLAGVALQSVLAEKAGVPSPYVTSDQVEAYFQAHKGDYPQVAEDPSARTPESWAAADAQIRAKLTPLLQAEHDKQMSRFIADLKSKANVVIASQDLTAN